MDHEKSIPAQQEWIKKNLIQSFFDFQLLFEGHHKSFTLVV